MLLIIKHCSLFRDRCIYGDYDTYWPITLSIDYMFLFGIVNLYRFNHILIKVTMTLL